MGEAGRSFANTDVITDLGHDVFQIDTRMAGYHGITAGYLIRGDRPCLVETGTAPSAPVVRDALTALGVEAGDLTTIVVTHIHLDHAGGTGDIAAMFPSAQVVVHELGARHLADPSRLMASARMVYGDELDGLFGRLAPTPAERIRTVERTGVVDLGGGRRLESHHAPGHARHHVGLIDSGSGDLYVGDAAGIYIQETGDMRPATPPPDFDLDIALESLRMFGALSRRDCSSATSARLPPSMRRWRARLRRSVSGSRRPAERARPGSTWTMQRRWWPNGRGSATASWLTALTPRLAAKYERTGGTHANVAGIMRWLDKDEAAT